MTSASGRALTRWLAPCWRAAQVHKATLSDGRQVAVKVQHAGLPAAIRADMATLRFIAVRLPSGPLTALAPSSCPAHQPPGLLSSPARRPRCLAQSGARSACLADLRPGGAERRRADPRSPLGRGRDAKQPREPPIAAFLFPLLLYVCCIPRSACGASKKSREN